jgi:hypothetical protein
MATQITEHNRQDEAHRSSREIQRDIDQTRHEMDETLEQLGERLHPRHLLDRVIDYLRSPSTSSRATADRLREAGAVTAHQVKQHPVPVALIGAGLAWWLVESSQRSDNGERERWSGTSQPLYPGPRTAYPGPRTTAWEKDYATEWDQEVAAWHPAYDWSKSDQDEKAWSQRARTTLDSLKSTFTDSAKSASEKVRHAASSVIALSGQKREAIHARWAHLREHSGSFVDARTGEPYDQSYGREWRNLAAADFLTDEGEPAESEGWSQKAEHVVKEAQEALAKGGENVKESLRSLASKLGEFGSSAGSFSSHYARQMGRGAGTLAGRASTGASRMASGAAEGARSLASGARDMGSRVQERVQDGYRSTRHQLSDTIEQHPLAAGAAALGLGLIAGFLLPHTRAEDRWMGEASDDVKHRAKEAGEEAVARGKEVASATAAAAMEEAERQGIAPSQLGEKARSTAENVKRATEEKVKQTTHELAEKAQRVASRAKDTARSEMEQKKREYQS